MEGGVGETTYDAEEVETDLGQRRYAVSVLSFFRSGCLFMTQQTTFTFVKTRQIFPIDSIA